MKLTGMRIEAPRSEKKTERLNLSIACVLVLQNPSRRRWLSGPYTRDVLWNMLFERLHEGFEVFLAADFPHVLRREVGVHARPVPVSLDGLAIQFDIHLVFLAQTHEEVAGRPGIVRGFGRAFGENLEFPLALRHFRWR